MLVFAVLHDSHPPNIGPVLSNPKVPAFVVVMRLDVFIVVNTFCGAKIAETIVEAIAVDVIHLKIPGVRAAAEHPDNPVNQISLSPDACRKVAAVVDGSSGFSFYAAASRNAPDKVPAVNVPRKKLT